LDTTQYECEMETEDQPLFYLSELKIEFHRLDHRIRLTMPHMSVPSAASSLACLHASHAIAATLDP